MFYLSSYLKIKYNYDTDTEEIPKLERQNACSNFNHNYYDSHTDTDTEEIPKLERQNACSNFNELF